MPRTNQSTRPATRAPSHRPRQPITGSPLVLCDHMISLAQEADRAGYPATASHLVALLDRVFEEQRVSR